MGLHNPLCSNSKYTLASGAGEPGRYALHGPDAGIRQRSTAWWSKHPGITNGSLGCRCPCGSYVPGCSQKRARSWQIYPNYGGRFWGRIDRIFILEKYMAVTLTYGRYGPRIYGPNGCQQHRLTDYRRRRQTRAGNEFLYDGVHGYSAIRKFAGRHRGREN